MSENKAPNNKVFSFFDWVWRLMVLNMMMLLFSVGIITIMPTICAGFKTIKDTKENYTPKIVKPFISNFLYLFRDTFVFSIILVAVIGIAGYAFLWYDGVVGATGGSNNQLDQTWLIIAMVSITIVVVGIAMISMAFVQIPMVLNYFYYGFIDNIKLSFYMAFKYFITTLIEVIVMAASVILLINALFLYHLLPLWLFFGISVPLYIDYIISQRFYRYVSGQTEDDEEEIDYQNKIVNRETYEDNNITKK